MKAVIYARYSSDNQRHESIEAQIRAIKDYAEKNRIHIVKTYIDEAKSATTDNRPNFLQMIKDCEMGLFDAVIVHKLDRFSRDRYDSAYYKRKLKNANVQLISVTENLDGSPESIILESMLEGMAEYYSKNLSREVMKGMTETALQCKHTGGYPPLGYDVDQDNHYIINKEEAIAVKKIFTDYINGKSYKEIVDWLNSSGYKTKQGNTFKYTGLHSILKNEKYTGTYIYNKTKRVQRNSKKINLINPDDKVIRIENGMPAIITKEEFDIVQRRLIQNKKDSQSFRSKEVYLLSGKIYCGKCGGHMAGSRRQGGRNKKLYVTYQCMTRKTLKTCDMKEVDKVKIETLVLKHLEEVIFTDEFIDTISKETFDRYQRSIEEANSNIKVFEEKLKKIHEQINNIVTAIANGMYHESMKQKMDELELEKSEVISMIADERAKNYHFTLEDIKKYLSQGKDITKKSIEEQKKIIDTFVEKVVVYDDEIKLYLYLDAFNTNKKAKSTSLKGDVDTLNGGGAQFYVSTLKR